MLATWRPQFCRVRSDIPPLLASRLWVIQERVLNSVKSSNSHLSITLMYINSQNTAVRSSISYYSFRYFIVVSFRRHVSAHSFGPSSGLTNILESTTVCNACKAYIMILNQS